MNEPSTFEPLGAATLPPHYHHPDIFASENAGLFAHLWIFVGLSSDLPHTNDFFRISLSGYDVIVQNTAAGLRAFANTCSHRHARIHEELRGNRRLVCPYHGWAYSDDGIPTGIPQSEQFPQVCANRAGYGLRRFELDVAGQFIFVRVEPGRQTLEEFLGPAHEFLRLASAGFDRCMDEFHGTVDANWKILIENALEGYHVPVVHRATLGAIRQFSTDPVDVTDHLPDSGHSYMVHKASGEWLKRWKRFERALGRWPFYFEHYVHRLIYPNLTVTSFMGYSFHVQRFIPEAVGRTTVHSRIFSVHCDGQTPEGSRVMAKVYDEGIAFTRSVFAEDQRACELVYQGIQQAQRPAVLAAHAEKRVGHFQRHYASTVGPDRKP